MFRKLIWSIIRKLGRPAHTWYCARRLRSRDKIQGLVDRMYFRENDNVSKEKRKINFHTLAWGGYLDSFFSYTAPSLLQDGNIPSLARDGYDLNLTMYTQPWEYQEISEKYGPCLDLLKKCMAVNIIPIQIQENRGTGYYWRLALTDQIRRCLDEEAVMFFTPPDTIYGNQSIANAVTTVQGKNVCLSAAHARVSKESIKTSEVFDGLKRMDRIVENDELVDLAFMHGHPALLGAFDNEDSNRTLGGVSIRKINNNNYAVIHNLPTVYLANFVPDDLKFFTGTGSPWDGRWMRLLMRHNRLKVVGSSDLFFCVELTANDRNVHPLGPGLLNNDKYLTKRERYLHNYVFNSYCSIWRGRGATNAGAIGAGIL